MRIILVAACALLMLSAASPPASAECTPPAPVSACSYDGDGDGWPDYVIAGSQRANTYYVYGIGTIWTVGTTTSYIAGVIAGTPSNSPVGYHYTVVSVHCYDYESDQDCDFLHAGSSTYTENGQQHAYLRDDAGGTRACVTGDFVKGTCVRL